MSDVSVATETPPAKRRGRPPGSKNKATLAREEAQRQAMQNGSVVEAVEAPAKRRGRPPGTKNKTTQNRSPAVVEASTLNATIGESDDHELVGVGVGVVIGSEEHFTRGAVVARHNKMYRPQEDPNPPQWVNGSCTSIAYVREGEYKRPEDRYIKTSEEAADHYRKVHQQEPPAPPVFCRGTWLIPIRGNEFLRGGMQTVPPTVMEQDGF